jgi:hypothetical protein
MAVGSLCPQRSLREAVIIWVAAKTETSLATAESELLAIMDSFHIVRLEDSGPAKIAEIFEKYRED